MDELSEKADKLITNYAFSSSIAGFIPLPFADTLGVISVQHLMLIHLSKLYNIPCSQNLAKAWQSSLMGGIPPAATSSTLKIIPGIGTVAGGISVATMGSASTYAIGKVFQQHFEGGGTLDNFEPEKAIKKAEQELKDKGRWH